MCADGERITVCKAGCFKPPGLKDVVAGEWSGLLLLSDVRGRGECLVHPIPYDAVLETYGEAGYAQQLRTRRARDAQNRADIEMI